MIKEMTNKATSSFNQSRNAGDKAVDFGRVIWGTWFIKNWWLI
jgi:hypothetical protein